MLICTKIPRQNTKMCICAHTICNLCFWYAPAVAGKICVHFHKLCVIYTNLGQKEALINHWHKAQLTLTQHNFFHLWSLPPFICTCTGNKSGKTHENMTCVVWLAWNAICDLWFRFKLLQHTKICVTVICGNATSEICFWYAPIILPAAAARFLRTRHLSSDIGSMKEIIWKEGSNRKKSSTSAPDH